MEYDRGRKP